MTALDKRFAQKYGPWALVTGAAEGMGAGFAEVIAAEGLNLVLLDRQGETLANTAARLREEYGVDAIELVVELGDDAFIDTVTEATAQLEVGLVISCAALGQVGAFVDSDLHHMKNIVDINVKAPLALTHRYAAPMASRGRGGIVLISSDSAYHGSPYVGHYAATKAYSLILGESLWYELSKAGVDVLGFAPGATNTPGLRKANPRLKEGQKVKGIMLPRETAQAALAALGKSPSARPNFRTTLETVFMTRVLSRRRAIKKLGDIISSKLAATIDKK